MLSRSTRDGNTISALLRTCWDGETLQTLTQSDPLVATGAHITIIGHTTDADIRRHLTDTDQANGFANRFLWCLARRSKVLPFGGSLSAAQIDPLKDYLAVLIQWAMTIERVDFDAEGRDLWQSIYPELSRGECGLFGAVTARAEAQVLRLACLYSLLDGKSQISASSIRAALAVWEYCKASARHVFGARLGDPTADAILSRLRNSQSKLSRTQISRIFSGNKPAHEIDRALSLLLKLNLASCEMSVEGEGRPTEVWSAP